MQLKFHLGLTNEKFISVSLEKISTNLTFNNIKIEGSWILSFLARHVNWFNGEINSSINKILNKFLSSNIEILNKKVQKSIEIPAIKLAVDLKMENEVMFNDDFFELDFNLDINDLKESQPKFLAKTEQKNDLFRMIDKFSDSHSQEEIQIAVDTKFINNFLFYSLRNYRNLIITNDSIPKDFPFKMNTLYFTGLIPEMYSKYPNKDLSITLEIDSMPTVELNSTQIITSDLVYSISYALLEDPSTTIFSLSVGSQLSLRIDSTTEDSTIHLQINSVGINDVIVMLSTFGEQSSEAIKTNLNTFLNSLSYFINNYLKINPIPIPVVKGLKFDSINIMINTDDYLIVKCRPNIQESKLLSHNQPLA